jgi:hypothetical protein
MKKAIAKKAPKKSGPKIKRGAKGKPFSANLPEPLLKKFTAMVKKLDRSRNDVIFELVKGWIDSAKVKPVDAILEVK